jgi:signal-transduction protein with cAMP-binding, CBS, and nucleotidyltransferase domain
MVPSAFRVEETISQDWIENANPQSILEINVFFDIRCDFGDDSLVNELHNHVQVQVENNPQFFIHFAYNCLSYKEPLDLLGRIRSENKDGAKTFNIKASSYTDREFRKNICSSGTILQNAAL